MVKIAVVILNWNGRNFLEKFLPSVILYSPEATVYVADNNSSDHSVDYLRTSHPEVNVILNPHNGGFSEGYNLALKQIEATYYVLLNSDVEVTPGWLAPMVSLMDQHPEIAACQPKILSYYQKDHFEYAGAAGGFIDAYGFPFCRGRLFNNTEQDLGQYDDSIQVFWASGACMFARAKAYHAAGGLDNDFFAHMEEIDLCWRWQKLGWKIYYCGQSLVYHVGGGSLSKSNPQKTYLNFRNNIALIVKNHPAENFWKILLIRLVLDGMAGFKFLFSSGLSHFWAVLRAHFYIYRHIPALRKKRRALQLHTAAPAGVYPGSVVFAHFVKQRKRFTELNFRD